MLIFLNCRHTIAYHHFGPNHPSSSYLSPQGSLKSIGITHLVQRQLHRDIQQPHISFPLKPHTTPTDDSLLYTGTKSKDKNRVKKRETNKKNQVKVNHMKPHFIHLPWAWNKWGFKVRFEHKQGRDF